MDECGILSRENGGSVTPQSWNDFIIVVGVMKSRRLKWAGHVVRIKEEHWPMIFMEMVAEGKSLMARPRRRWMNRLREDMIVNIIILYRRQI